MTFWYKDTETERKITVTMDKFEFIGLLLSHIPEKNFKIVRYIGIYSRRGYRHTQTEFHDAEMILIKKSWREEIKKTFDYDPLICPYCNTEMELVGICYEGTESYPTVGLPPVKPPPNIQFSQQQRIQLIVALIIENHNERGANIEKVVAEATKKGIDRDQILSDIQHLKVQGEAYEPKRGEIRYVF